MRRRRKIIDGFPAGPDPDRCQRCGRLIRTGRIKLVCPDDERFMFLVCTESRRFVWRRWRQHRIYGRRACQRALEALGWRPSSVTGRAG